MQNNNVINLHQEESGKELLPVHVVDRLLGGKNNIRIALVEHPVMHELAPCISYKDYAEAFSYDHTAIFKMIQRTKWLKKHSVIVMMATTDGKFYKTLCVFEQAALGIFMKLLPHKCKDKDVAARIEERQEELILILHDALKGYNKGLAAGYPFEERQGFLPRPGLTMDAIAHCTREADRRLGGKVGLYIANYFTGMPVDHLIQELEALDIVSSELAGIIAQYFNALLTIDMERFEITSGTTETGARFVEGEGRAFYIAFLFLQRKDKLPKIFTSLQGLSGILSREAPALEYLGIRRILNHHIEHGGKRIHRFEFLKQKES